MSGFGSIILIILVIVAAVIWPTRKAAQMVGAERTGYGTVLLALALSVFLMVGLGFFLALTVGQGVGGGIAAGLLLALALVFVYAKVFGTGMIGGFLIWLISQVIGVLLWLALSAVLGVGSLFFDAESETERVSAAVDSICACQGAQACIDMQMAVVEGEIETVLEAVGPQGVNMLAADLERMNACLEHAAPAAAPPSTSPRRDSATSDGSSPAVAAPAVGSSPAQAKSPQPPVPAPAKRFIMIWQDTSIDQLVTQIGELLRFELQNGREREGILVSVTDDGAELRSAVTRGLAYSVDLSAVKSVKVRKRVVQ